MVNYFFNLSAQVWSEKYCLNFLNELAEKDSNITKNEIETVFGSKIDSFNFHLKNLYFNKNDKIENILIKHNNFIDKLHPEYVTDHGSVRENIYYSVKLYLESLNYKANDNLGLVYEILESSSRNLLHIPLEKLNATQLIELYISQNEAKRKSILSTIVSGDLFDKIQLDSFWHVIDPIEKNILEVYQMKLAYANRFEDPHQRDSVINQVKQQFIQLMDTNNPRHVMLFKQNFDFENYINDLARESIRKNDSIMNEMKAQKEQIIKTRNDSILQTIDFSNWPKSAIENLYKMMNQGDDLLPYFIEDTSNYSADEKREMRAMADTTLMTEYFSPDLGDDGIRFDTLSNERLFQELENINLNTIKQEYNTEYMVNTQPKVIHLHKIVQLMGDRYIAKSLIPTPSQQVQIEALLDFLEYEIKVDTNDLWNYISKKLMYRLWYLGVPRMKQWLESENRFLFVFASNNLHLFADEDMVKEYIQKFEAQYAIDGNRGKADIYLSALERIHTWKEFNPSYQDLPPRRIPTRSFEDSYEWCVKYIWPAFVKIGWLVEDK